MWVEDSGEATGWEPLAREQRYAPTHLFSSQKGTWGAVPLSEAGDGLQGAHS